jgi:hypothetical protein
MLKQRAARSGFTSGLLQRQIGDGGQGRRHDGGKSIASSWERGGGNVELGNRMQTTVKRQASRSKSRLRLRVLKFHGAASLGCGGNSLKMEKEM